MRLAIAWIMMGAALCIAQDTPNNLSRKESGEGWVLLFDGKTLNGWTARPTSDPASKGDWKVENGSMVCGGTTPSWIATDATFSDYRLTLEFRGAEKVNSGVFLRSQKDRQPHITGYELQIWDYQPAGFHTGSLVGSLKAAPTKILPGQWNKYDITADGDHFVIVLNGKTLLDAREAKHKSGVIGFQCQKDQRIEFRNIKLRTIPKRGAALLTHPQPSVPARDRSLPTATLLHRLAILPHPRHFLPTRDSSLPSRDSSLLSRDQRERINLTRRHLG